MIAVVSSAWALFLGIALIMLGNGLQGSLLGLRASLEGFPTAVTGVIMTGYFVGFLGGSVVVPRLLRRVGHIRVFAALASLASTAVLSHAVFVDPVPWFAMRLVTGFCYAGLYVVAESWLNDRATNETRGQLLSIYMVVMLGAMGAGQFLLNAADPQSFELFVLISVLVSLGLVPMLLTASPAPDFTAPEPIGLRRLYQISPLGVFGTFLTVMAQGGLFSMGAVYAKESGLSVAEISVFMASGLFGGMLLQWPVGRVSDRLDRRRVITVVTFLASFAAFAAVVTTGSLAAHVPAWSLYLWMALIGGLNMPMYSLTLAHTNDFLEPKQMVAASSGLVLVGGLGAVLGPMSLAGAMSVLGPVGYFWGIGAIHGAIGGFALYRMTRRGTGPVEEQGAFVAVPPRASPLATSLSPDGQDAGDAADAGAEPAPAAKAVDPSAQRG